MEQKSFPMGELPKVIQEATLKKLATEIVKLQKFKSSVAIHKLPGDYTINTKANYFRAGVRYLKDRTRLALAPNDLYNYIDEAIAKHVQPLTPKEDEKSVPRKDYTRKEAVLPVQKIIEEIKQVEPKCYAVQVDKNIIVQNTINDARAFAEGLRFLGGKDIDLQIIEIKIKVIE